MNFVDSKELNSHNWVHSAVARASAQTEVTCTICSRSWIANIFRDKIAVSFTWVPIKFNRIHRVRMNSIGILFKSIGPPLK